MNKQFSPILALATMALLFSACFKDTNDNTNPGAGGTSGGSNYNLNDRLIAYYNFDNENGRDASSYGRDGNFPNEAHFVQGITGKAVFLNGMQDVFFQIPYNFFAERSAWSVSFWVKDLTEGCVFAAQSNSGSDYYYDAPVLWANADGKLAINLHGGYDNTTITYNYSNTANKWRHIVIVAEGVENYYGSATVKCYVDGSLVDNTTSFPSISTINNCTKIVFGGDKNGGYSVAPSFYLDEVRFYSRALTRDEAVALYNYDK